MNRLHLPFLYPNTKFCVLCYSLSLPVIQNITCLMKILTDNKFNVEGLTRLKTWKNASVAPAVGHLCIIDLYGGVAVLQLILKM